MTRHHVPEAVGDRVQMAQPGRGELLRQGGPAEVLVHAVGPCEGFATEPNLILEGGLHHGRDECRSDAMAAHVRDHHGRAAIQQRQDRVDVSADARGRQVSMGVAGAWRLPREFGQQPHLEGCRQLHLFLHPGLEGGQLPVLALDLILHLDEPEGRIHLGQHFLGVEGLGNHVVRAQGQAADARGRPIQGGQDDEVDVAAGRIALDALAQFVARHLGHAQVRDDEIGPGTTHLFQGLEAIPCGQYLVARPLEIEAENVPDGCFIVHHQDGALGHAQR